MNPMENAGQNEEEVQPIGVLGVLNPSRPAGTMWFKRDNIITHEIRTIIRSDFPGPYRNWSKTPIHVRERWWHTFRSKFHWNHMFELQVRRMFQKSAATKLMDMISRVKERGQQPYWILDNFYQELVAYWATDVAKEKSKKASKSRMSDRNGLGPHKHRAGSRSYAKVADMLKKKNKDASYIDVLRETHIKDGSFVDQRAKMISDEFEKNVADRIFQDETPAEELTLEEKNKMYLKLFNPTKDRVFGLGALLGEIPNTEGSSANIGNQLENDEALKKKVEEIIEENTEIKERVNKLEGLEKMLEILLPHLSSARGNN